MMPKALKEHAPAKVSRSERPDQYCALETGIGQNGVEFEASEIRAAIQKPATIMIAIIPEISEMTFQSDFAEDRQTV